ncbi:M24 family metallopeptidase [Sinisalibacter lacisalsi]|uniref:Ectoine hydrolase DoeA n=1 Tax=Sinisalibacter lacisalsi TaxID=1526570 RepID=A0ABQ1QQH1_9RHOB|nr:M24 family metallopeptidase [Sinisalibacter lacisalsi]GGD40845.1 ectoine hydrolase DoeA [Sinisalibacter lacisalsi]
MDSFRAPFSASEYARRLEAARAAMALAGLDALVVTDPSNIAWLTGYDGWSFYTHQAVILDHAEDPIWWGRMQDTNGARRTVWMGADRILGYADHFVQSTTCHPMQELARHLVERGFATGRVGVEKENYYYSAKAHEVLGVSLPDARLADATALVNRCRAVKSDEELGLMRKAAAISDHVIRTAIEAAVPGLRKNALVAEIYSAMITGVGEDWGDYPAIVPMLPSGPDAAAPHLTWNGDRLKAGEGTFFEISGAYRRYHAPLCRTVFLGRPPQDMLDAHAALLEGLEAGLDVARAGNRACDIANALGRALEKAGIERSARCGYPIGLSYPPDWGERTISLRTSDDTILEPGMSFHFMPGLWVDDWGIETTESLVIREDGPPEVLGTVPRQLFVKD